jgi:hypothetical protein
MKKNGVLILSHCGYSFVDQIVPLAANEDLQVYICSSRPDNGHEHRIDTLKNLTDWVQVTDNHELVWQDVEDAIISLQEQGVALKACISVWEGYRSLMAQANEILGIPDLSASTVKLLTNKLALRQQLFNSGLSEAVVEPLTKELLERYKKNGAQKFIKPRHGIASFGTFRLTQDISWQDIEAIQKEWMADTVYRSIFDKEDNFIVEDFIKGVESSFEILVVDGELYTIAIHEKIETSAKEMTTLENACICPPVSITEGETMRGIHWMKDIFSALKISQGCFHVEAKCDKGQWEIIEINPRVGGSLISPSVEYFTNGSSMLKLWLKTLICTENNKQNWLNTLSLLDLFQQGASPSNRATFFRVYYGDAGVVDDVIQSPISPEPLCCQILVKPGTEFHSEAKENFVGQALWGDSMEMMCQHYDRLLKNSNSLLKVRYALLNQGAA